jgi:hypothetical protein
MDRIKSRYIGVLVLLLLAAVLAVMWYDRQRASRATAHVSALAAKQDAHPPDITSSPRSSSVPAATSPAATVAATGRSEICGYGKAPAQITTSEALNQYVGAMTEKIIERWRTALLDSSDVRARAVGLMSRRVEYNRHKQEQTRDDDPVSKADEAAREELVQLAAGGGDPAVYAAATWFCETGMSNAIATGACARISLREWTRVDPDNAVAWLAVAREEHDHGDFQAEAADFARAASAHRSDFYDDIFLQAALAEIPPDATPLQRAALGIEALGSLAVIPRIELAEAGHFCSPEQLQREERRQSCDAVAELWVSHGKTLLEFGTGRLLGGRVGWSPERRSRLNEEFKAMMGVMRWGDDNAWSCQNVARANELLAGRVQGEVAYLRDKVERSGSSPPN